MRILVVSTDYPPMKGGIAVLSHSTALEFQRAGHEVCVLASCLDFQAARHFDAQQPFSTVRFSGRLPWRELQIAPKLWLTARRFQPDVIWSALWYPAGVAASFVAPRSALQTVSTYGSEIFLSTADWKLRLKARMSPLRLRVFQRCHHIFALSRYTREKIFELGAPPAKVSIVAGGVENGWFDLQPCPPPPDRPVLLTVARLDEHKGHDRVLEALPTVVERYPGLIYRCVGPGEENWPRLQKMAQQLGVEQHVEYLGPLPFAQLQQAYQQATLFVMVSREVPGRLDLVEGFGLTFLEAAAVGLASVAGDSGGVPDAVEHEVSGLLVDPTSPPEIAAALLRLLDNPPLREQLGRQGRQRALDGFRWQHLAGQMLDAFETAIPKENARV
jgi:phosphatidylinositol alpha-1,6-mannosyltransferase